MPIATSLAVVVLASSLAGSAPAAKSLPPITIDVTIAPDVPVTLVSRVLDETNAVWRPSGLTFVWNRHRTGMSIADAVSGPPAGRGIEVAIGHDRGVGRDQEREYKTALGWIVFSEPEVPSHQIYLSYENAVAYMTGARGVVGPIEQMTIMEREMKLARAMGRALAHELGHYLLASKTHTPRGLMQAVHTASDFFGYPRSAFAIDKAQRESVTERLRREPLVASRWSAVADAPHR
jgi:hypothetical protein